MYHINFSLQLIKILFAIQPEKILGRWMNGTDMFLNVFLILSFIVSVVLTLKEQLWDWLSLGLSAQITLLE